MKYVVYILYSNKLKRFYTGFTSDMDQRMAFHNSGANRYSSKGIPWIIVHVFDVDSKQKAMALEKQIKRNGAERYLIRNNIKYTFQ